LIFRALLNPNITTFMARGDITIYDEGAFGYPGDDYFNVAASATLINPGEPVTKALGNTSGAVVTPMATNKPVVATDFLAGIATTTSTNTSTAAGSVRVMKITNGVSYLISPNVAATWNTQAKYDALVGARVLLDLTAGAYTILASDGATSGCVIQELDVIKHPGKVRFTFREGVNYLA
jgi:hypothetical protein